MSAAGRRFEDLTAAWPDERKQRVVDAAQELARSVSVLDAVVLAEHVHRSQCACVVGRIRVSTADFEALKRYTETYAESESPTSGRNTFKIDPSTATAEIVSDDAVTDGLPVVECVRA